MHTASPPITEGRSCSLIDKATALGNPDKIVDLGAKQVYIYKDMKVIFMDERVSDVE
jgi:hypothetical protein